MASLSKMHRVVFLAAYAVVAGCLFGPTVAWGQDVDKLLKSVPSSAGRGLGG
jgi:hypothetical protein